jgi:RNase P/RNase MRP subunit p29
MKRKLGLVVAIAAAVALLATGIAWAAETYQASEPKSQNAARPADSVVRGTVTAVAGDRVSVETRQGDAATLLITNTTRMWVPGEAVTTTVELAVGDPVLALGRPVESEGGEKALVALLVTVVSDEDLPKVLIRGKVVAVTRQTLVVEAGRGERAITILPRTRLWSPRGRLDGVSDLLPGDLIVALGQPTELGQWVAGLVLVPGAQPAPAPLLRGVVTAKDAGAATLTVETERRGEVTIQTSGATRYRIPGVEKPDLSDVQVGDSVVVVGRLEPGSESTVRAQAIAVIPPERQKQP